jgi:hypothetical protein
MEQLDYSSLPHAATHYRVASMPEIPDITESEHWIIETTLTERYGNKIEIQIADAEIRLMPSDRELSSCPVIYWNKDGCNFIIFKTASRKYRCQFFYRGYQQYGTGVDEYDDLTECIVSLLQAQADHVARERGDI